MTGPIQPHMRAAINVLAYLRERENSPFKTDQRDEIDMVLPRNEQGAVLYAEEGVGLSHNDLRILCEHAIGMRIDSSASVTVIDPPARQPALPARRPAFEVVDEILVNLSKLESGDE